MSAHSRSPGAAEGPQPGAKLVERAFARSMCVRSAAIRQPRRSLCSGRLRGRKKRPRIRVPRARPKGRSPGLRLRSAPSRVRFVGLSLQRHDATSSVQSRLQARVPAITRIGDGRKVERAKARCPNLAPGSALRPRPGNANAAEIGGREGGRYKEITAASANTARTCSHRNPRRTATPCTCRDPIRRRCRCAL